MEASASLLAREAQLQERPVPAHVGIIMDGNGRWAEERELPRLSGHRQGSDSVKEITRCARRMGVRALTLYAFSSQNWARPAEEVAGLMELLRDYLHKERAEILDNGVRLNAIGELDRLPRYVREPLEELRAASSGNRKGMTLTLALSYGGREELASAARKLAESVQRGTLQPAEVTAESLESQLWTHGLPPLDLVIRTSGEHRISNFLLWQAAYAELVFVDTLWPDFRAEAFLDCVAEFQQRERRYGLTSAQLPRAGEHA